LNEAVRQSVFDVHRLSRWLAARNGRPVGLFGVSLGGYVTAVLAGLRADLVILDSEDVDFEGLVAAAQLGVAMFSGNCNRVRDVYVAGRPVIEDGRHASEDEARDAFRRSLARLRAAP